MALNKLRAPQMKALILRAAAEVRHLNPHIGAAQQVVIESEYAEVERERQQRERLWDEMERQRSAPDANEPAAQAVDADRGE